MRTNENNRAAGRLNEVSSQEFERTMNEILDELRYFKKTSEIPTVVGISIEEKLRGLPHVSKGDSASLLRDVSDCINVRLKGQHERGFGIFTEHTITQVMSAVETVAQEINFDRHFDSKNSPQENPGDSMKSFLSVGEAEIADAYAQVGLMGQAFERYLDALTFVGPNIEEYELVMGKFKYFLRVLRGRRMRVGSSDILLDTIPELRWLDEQRVAEISKNGSDMPAMKAVLDSERDRLHRKGLPRRIANALLIQARLSAAEMEAKHIHGEDYLKTGGKLDISAL